MKTVLCLTINTETTTETTDGSGLPTYAKSFINNLKDDCNLVVINMIINRYQPDGFEQVSDNWYNISYGRFLDSFSSDVNRIIADIVYKTKPDIVIENDYLWEAYLDQFNIAKQFKKIFFVHLCQRGFHNILTKQPEFSQDIRTILAVSQQKDWLEWRAVTTADVIIANSNFTAKEIIRHYPEYNGLLVSAPLGINIDNFDFAPALDSKQIAYFGRLDIQKGIDYIIEDCNTRVDDYKEYPLKIIGEGFLEHRMMKLHFYKVLDFQGMRCKEDLKKELKDVKYCLFPSIYEPYGLALNEALAMGKICLVNSIDSGMLEQLHDGENANAFLVDYKVNSIIDIIKEIEEMPRERQELVVNNARKFARNEKEHFAIIKKIILEQ